MTQAQLLNEFSQLSLPQQLEVIQGALHIMAQQFRSLQPHTNGHEDQKRLEEAANLLLADYMEDKELTSFTALDGEPFYAEG